MDECSRCLADATNGSTVTITAGGNGRPQSALLCSACARNLAVFLVTAPAVEAPLNVEAAPKE